MEVVASREYDLLSTQCSAEGLAEACVDHLAIKGFCVIRDFVGQDLLSKVGEDLQEMEDMGKFSTPPSLIGEGLFGQEGSFRIAEMDAPDDLSTDGQTLRKLDELLLETSGNVNDFLASTLGVDCRTRTRGLVHETSTEIGDVPELKEKEASIWLNTFIRSKLMFIICLGPTAGTLELRPFEDEDAQAVELVTNPGTLIILRADMLFHHHYAHAKVHLLSCYLLEPKTLDKRATRKQGQSITPVAQAIDNWCLGRLQVLKANQEIGVDLVDIPADFKRAMNQVCFKGQRAAIRTVGWKACPTYDVDTWHNGLMSGPDFATNVPTMRWDNTPNYEEHPEGWRIGKTFVNHGAFIDGIDLFDNKIFTLSPAESMTMDPHQTNTLESGFEALFKCGYTKKTLSNAICGVYVGTATSDWPMVPKQCESAGCATGGAASITCGRFSFLLGLKGPCLAIDAEAAAALSAVDFAAESVLEKGRGVRCKFSMAGGVHFNLGPFFWPQLQAAGLLSPSGRCKTLDESADGFGFGEGCAYFCVERLTEKVDGQTVMIEGKPLLGVLAGCYMNNSGRSCSLGAPSATAEQEMVHMALRNSGLCASDVEAVEMHGDANYLSDAIEVGSLVRSLRYTIEDETMEPLALTSVKTHTGDSRYCSGAVGLVRVMMGQNLGLMAPNVHLNALNPHMEFDDVMNVTTELFEHRLNVSYVGVTAKGFCGTNVHAVTWGRVEKSERDPDERPTLKSVAFWPGGGGELDDDVVPRKKGNYFIAGTFNRWTPEQMEADGSDFAFTMVLGENRWEKFQIWLDGNEMRRLHPPEFNAFQGGEVLGPVSDSAGTPSWVIDGREASMLQDEAADASGAVVPVGSDSIRSGRPGDKFRIHLRIAGKYRAVEWERLPRKEGTPPEKVPEGTYSVFASWSDWRLDEMTRDDSEPNVFYYEVTLRERSNFFAIVRNEDMEQVIYPDSWGADDSANALGPDTLVDELFWNIAGRPGDVVRIEFRRTAEFGLDTKKVSWKKTSE